MTKRTAWQELFWNGMKRELPDILPIPDGDGPVFNLGCGMTNVPGATGLDWPEWDARTDLITCPDGEARGIHAYHFLEHLYDPLRMLREIQRVLMVGGVLNIVVPYYSSQLQSNDLTHSGKTFCEETWRNLFANTYYEREREDWQFDIGFNLIAGIKERNLVLFTQLIKTPPK